MQESRSWAFAKGSGLTALLSRPLISWITSDAEIHHWPRPQFDSHKHKDGAEERIVGLGEITGPNPVGAITQEGGPGLSRYPMHPHAYLDPLDQALVDINSRLPWFSPNALRAPSRAVPGGPHCRADNIGLIKATTFSVSGGLPHWDRDLELRVQYCLKGLRYRRNAV